MAEILINGRTFRCEMLPAMDGLAMFTRCLDAAGPFMSLMGDEVGSGTMGELIGGMMGQLNDPKLRKLVQDIAETCHVDGQPVVVGANLQDPLEILEVVAWAAEAVHVGPFMRDAGLKRAGERLMRIMTASA